MPGEIKELPNRADERDREFDKIVGNDFGQQGWRRASRPWTASDNLSVRTISKAHSVAVEPFLFART
jgi:hypothetical protein